MVDIKPITKGRGFASIRLQDYDLAICPIDDLGDLCRRGSTDASLITESIARHPVVGPIGNMLMYDDRNTLIGKLPIQPI